MKILNIFKIFGKTETKNKTGKFSNFLLNASEKKKEKVFLEAARKANEDQKKIFEQYRLKKNNA
ncbi:hypothetical protein FJZ55_09270 [Candidatus Woesearchaeota archaeon]|nr:hypothetical protein [Candidatus Woesearchaeota archaeon]